MALAGALVTAVLPLVIRWGSSCDFSKSGWREVTKGDGLLWSVLAVGLWLIVVAAWHGARAPFGHAREVIAVHLRRIESLTEERDNARRNTTSRSSTFHSGTPKHPLAVVPRLLSNAADGWPV